TFLPSYLPTFLPSYLPTFLPSYLPTFLPSTRNVLNSFNTADEAKMESMIELLAVLYVAIAVQMFITQFLQTACMTSLAAHQTRRIREDYFRALVRQPISFFDSKDQGALATSVMESTLLIQDGLGEKLALAVQFSCSFVFGLAVALYYCWQLALVVCAVVPIMAVFIGQMAGMLTTSTEAATTAYNGAGSLAQEALGSVRTVYGFNAEQATVRRYVEQLRVAEKAGRNKWLATGKLVGAVSMMMWLVYALGLWYGARLIADDMSSREECNWYLNPDNTLHEPASSCLSGGDVMTCFFAILFGGLQLGQAFPAISAITSAKVELGKVLAVSGRHSEIDPSSHVGDKIPPERLQCGIEFSNVSFSYPARPDRAVYSGLNLCIEAGTTVALVG
ncbi:ABC transporter type 1, transmembrane domain-containing protein, partial [Ochromonadaceae sp. CCMP2298]